MVFKINSLKCLLYLTVWRPKVKHERQSEQVDDPNILYDIANSLAERSIEVREIGSVLNQSRVIL